VVNALKTAVLKEFQIGVGHADFFRGLAEAAGLEDDTKQELAELIANKNFFGVEELLDALHLPSGLKELFSMLGTVCMTGDMLQRAKELSAGFPVVLHALGRLEELISVLGCFH